MTQADLPPQANESDEVRALRALAAVAGWCVTFTTNGAHAATSLHKVKATNGYGRAVDLADRAGPGVDTVALLAINEGVRRLVPAPLIAELIYAGPGGICMKDGQVVGGLSVYGDAVMAEHHNHVHLGVTPGFIYNGAQEVTTPMPDDPNLPNIIGPVEFAIAGSDANGVCTGYYVFSHATGELHSFGPGAKFYGRSEVTKLVTS